MVLEEGEVCRDSILQWVCRWIGATVNAAVDRAGIPQAHPPAITHRAQASPIRNVLENIPIGNGVSEEV
jgi:hypothetical protein